MARGLGSHLHGARAAVAAASLRLEERRLDFFYRTGTGLLSVRASEARGSRAR
jgi:hypothetical protein